MNASVMVKVAGLVQIKIGAQIMLDESCSQCQFYSIKSKRCKITQSHRSKWECCKSFLEKPKT